MTVADPGFPVGGGGGGGGGRGPISGGAWTPDVGTFLAKMYAKMEELGPVGGACTRHAPPDPPMYEISIQ